MFSKVLSRRDAEDSYTRREFRILYYIKTKGGDAVKTVGPLYQGQAYGIAFPQGSPWREKTSIALLTLMEDGRYDRLYAKWFGTQNNTPQAD